MEYHLQSLSASAERRKDNEIVIGAKIDMFSNSTYSIILAFKTYYLLDKGFTLVS